MEEAKKLNAKNPSIIGIVLPGIKNFPAKKGGISRKRFLAQSAGRINRR
jgi:hypothetical protein